MEEERHKKEIDIAILHQKISDDLDFLKERVCLIEKNNLKSREEDKEKFRIIEERLIKFNERLIIAEKGIELAIRQASDVNKLELRYKTYAEEAMNKRAEEYKDKFEEEFDKREFLEKKYRKKEINQIWYVISIIGIAVLFILSFIGIINADFIKAII